MSLMVFCEIRDGRLAPAYEGTLVSIHCDWCYFPVDPVMALGALWVCPECFEEAEKKWKSTFSNDVQDLVKTEIGQ